jgi:hypothetical protein
LPFTQRASFRQYIGAAIITVIPDFMVVLAFRSFWLSGRSGFRSFRLSGRSGFLVVPAFRSFRLSGRSDFSKVTTYIY